MPPSHYDPTSPDEAPVRLPSAPRVPLSALGATLQPPLTRRGHGPGVIMFLPPADVLGERTKKPLDPDPQMKWAEEGFAVVAMVCARDDVQEGLRLGVQALVNCEAVDYQEKSAVLVYHPEVLPAVIDALATQSGIVCVVSYGATHQPRGVPLLAHVPQDNSSRPPENEETVHTYGAASPYFVIPGYSTYHPGSAAIAHTRSLVALRSSLCGPFFDIEKIWDEHAYFEFQVRSVAKTMGTMVQEPYVNHIPTMTGGIGREKLTAFYRDHFIFNNPADTELEVVSRTIGPDRIIDEFVVHLTHDRVVDWLLPGVPPTGKKLAIPMVSVVNVRGDRLCHEHIWWDQGTALSQAGALPTHVDHPAGRLRLPIAGVESARLLLDETDGASNQMFGPDWGVSTSS